jgi:hypothetical protein
VRKNNISTAWSAIPTLLLACIAMPEWAATPVTYPFSEARRIVVPRVVDCRARRQDGLKTEELRKEAVKRLVSRRYDAVAMDGKSSVLDAQTEESIKNADASLIRRVVPKGERFALILCIADDRSLYTFGAAHDVQLHVFLLDREQGKVAWSHVGGGVAAESDLAGVGFKTEMKGFAIQRALYRALEEFPKLPKAQ